MSYGPCSACGDGDTALKYHSHDVRDPRITVEQGRFSAERLYTLAEIEELAEQYADGLETTDCSKLSVQLTLSAWLLWLKKQETKDEARHI